VPEALFDRPKHGFDVPIADWLRGPLRDWAGDLLSPSRLGREGFVDPAQTQRLWQEHQKQTHDHAGALWAILMFEAWLDAAREARKPATPAGRFAAENGAPAYAGAAWLAPRQVGAENDQ
jgi:asparagine synthase (glutamine-hydrolysing)